MSVAYPVPLDDARLTTAKLLAILAAVAITARAATFGNPIIHVDEEFYLLTARSMMNGAIPYVDIWDRKPIGLFIIYLPPAIFPPAVAVYVYQLWALAFVTATTFIISRIVESLGWRSGGFSAAIFYILWLNLADGQGGQSPIYYNLLVSLAILITIKAENQSKNRHAGRQAMLAIGLAI